MTSNITSPLSYLQVNIQVALRVIYVTVMLLYLILNILKSDTLITLQFLKSYAICNSYCLHSLRHVLSTHPRFYRLQTLCKGYKNQLVITTCLSIRAHLTHFPSNYWIFLDLEVLEFWIYHNLLFWTGF